MAVMNDPQPMTDTRIRELQRLYDRNPQVQELVEDAILSRNLLDHSRMLNTEHYNALLAAREMLSDEQRDGLDARISKGEFRE
tara:strand:+ start:61 stop:309 length:249 start_codon:yes stop_codon:yes gene_type:complete